MKKIGELIAKFEKIFEFNLYLADNDLEEKSLLFIQKPLKRLF